MSNQAVRAKSEYNDRHEQGEEMKKEETFGKRIKEARLDRGLTLRVVADKLGVSLPYLSDIENDRRNPPDKGKLEQLMNILSLSIEERRELYDLAGKARDSVSPDIKDYSMDVDAVRLALRVAKDAGTTPDEWLAFAEKLQQRKRGE